MSAKFRETACISLAVSRSDSSDDINIVYRGKVDRSYLDLVYIADGVVEFNRPSFLHPKLVS